MHGLNSNYETREQWLNACVMAHRPFFDAAGYSLPLNIRASIGFPINGIRSSEIGVIVYPEASTDSHYEIFINPILKDGATVGESTIASTLTHELVHAALDYNLADRGHDQKTFGKLAKKILGLEGRCEATYAGADWYAWASPMLDALGPMPYSEISAALLKQKKTVPTWGIKVECPDCGWLARASKKHIQPHTHLNCPAPECDGILIAHWGD